MARPEIPRYTSDYASKGKVIIAAFHDTEAGKESVTVKEAEELEKLFKALGYDTHDLKVGDKAYKRERFMATLKKVSKELDKSSETMALVVICPQQNGKLRMLNRELFEMEDVYLKFNAKYCEGMKGKPKFFVFHTHPYRETKSRDRDAQAHGTAISDPVNPLRATVPLEADLLVLYSHEDYEIEGNEVSNFVEALKSVLKDDSEHKDALELMVDVASQCYKRNGPENPIPMVLSTLTDTFYLCKKKLQVEGTEKL